MNNGCIPLTGSTGGHTIRLCGFSWPQRSIKRFDMRNTVCVCQRKKEKRTGKGIKESGLMSPTVWESDVGLNFFFTLYSLSHK